MTAITRVDPRLMFNGPIIEISVAPCLADRERIKSEGKTPALLTIRAMLDTGAGVTVMKPHIFAKLGLTETRSDLIDTADSKVPSGRFNVDIMLLNTDDGRKPVINNLNVRSMNLPDSDFDCAIGRDILKGCILTYDGKNNTFSLSF